jgi:hypothetical protein
MKTINNELIRSFKPCYDPLEVGIPDDETISVADWVEKYRDVVKSKVDIIWLLCRNEFLSDKDLRLFAVWCARSAYKYCTKEHPIDRRSVAAVDCAERFAHGNATIEELNAAWSDARNADMAACSAQSSALVACSTQVAALAARNSASDPALCAAMSAVLVVRSAECDVENAEDDLDAESAWDAWDSEANAQIDKLLTYF